MPRTCVICGTSLAGKRKDAKTCSPKCRVALSQIKTQEAEAQTSDPTPVAVATGEAQATASPPPQIPSREENLIRRLEELKRTAQLRELELKQFDEKYVHVYQQHLELLTNSLKEVDYEIEDKRKMLSYSDDLLHTVLPREERPEVEYRFWQITPTNYNLGPTRQRLRNEVQSANYRRAVLKEQLAGVELHQRTAQQKRAMLVSLLQADRDRLTELENHYFRHTPYRDSKRSAPSKTEEIAQNQAEPQPKRRKGKTQSGLAVLETKFKPALTFRYKMGQFLGKIDRDKFVIALTGEAGAGKSDFSFYLSALFTCHELTVKYFSLEMGINETVQQKLRRYKLHKRFYITDEADLEDIELDAPEYDVIVVDSFGKLGAKADDLDRLRNQFPDTMFVFIFQKTTAGTMRGGSKIIYDCTMNINLRVDKETQRRQAVMVKARNAQQGQVFNVPQFQ